MRVRMIHHPRSPRAKQQRTVKKIKQVYGEKEQESDESGGNSD